MGWVTDEKKKMNKNELLRLVADTIIINSK